MCELVSAIDERLKYFMVYTAMRQYYMYGGLLLGLFMMDGGE